MMRAARLPIAAPSIHSRPMSPTQDAMAAVLPHFPVEIVAPDLSPWLPGNAGVAGVQSFLGPEPGPHVAILALTHGNEIAGAVVLDELLRAGLRPLRGRLSLVFGNPEAFARFDPGHPTASRYLDEDLNRLWDPATLDSTRHSRELARARSLRPLIDTVDTLVDLHSMLWPSDPLILCGTSARGRAFATALATPSLVVADNGHMSGRRLIDYPRFSATNGSARAILVEAGQHWRRTTLGLTREAVMATLRLTGMLAGGHQRTPASFVEVTDTVTATTSNFAFVKEFRGGEVISRRNTVIAVDGETEIRTPHDDCMLIMPSLRPARGHTAVRLARFV